MSETDKERYMSEFYKMIIKYLCIFPIQRVKGGSSNNKVCTNFLLQVINY